MNIITLLFKPQKFFQSYKPTSLLPPFKHISLFLLIPLIIYTYYSYAIPEMPVTPLMSVFMYLLFIFSTFVISLILHTFSEIFSKKITYKQAYSVTAYGMTPWALISWIPLINFIGIIWSWYVVVKGLSATAKISTDDSFFVTLISIPFIMLFFGLSLTAFFLSVGGLEGLRA